MKTFPLVIEAPKGSAIKYKFDPALGIFKVKKSLPLGMAFPYAFGFIKGTKGEDGDPLDAMIISGESYFTGCQLEARLVGALLAEQTEKGKKIRNDRYFFVPEDEFYFQHVKNIGDLGREHNRQLQDFFINYNKAVGKIFRPLRITNAVTALSLLNKLYQQP